MNFDLNKEVEEAIMTEFKNIAKSVLTEDEFAIAKFIYDEENGSASIDNVSDDARFKIEQALGG